MANLGPTIINGDLTVKGSIGGAVRLAYCNQNAQSSDIITTYLDVDSADSESVSVKCNIVDGSLLNEAYPRLSSGNAMPVIRTNNIWYSWTLFSTKISSSSSSGFSSSSSSISSSSSSSSSSNSSSSSRSSSSSNILYCENDNSLYFTDFVSDLTGWTKTSQSGNVVWDNTTYSPITAAKFTVSAGSGNFAQLLRDVAVTEPSELVISLRFRPVTLDAFGTTTNPVSTGDDFYIQYNRTATDMIAFSFAKVIGGSDYGIYKWTAAGTVARIGSLSFIIDEWQTWTFHIYSSYSKCDIYKNGYLVIDDVDITEISVASSNAGNLTFALYGNDVSTEVYVDWIGVGENCKTSSSSYSSSSSSS